MTDRILKFHASQGGKSFVGIKFSENAVDFYYPETFRWNKDINDIAVSDIDENISNSIRAVLSSIEFAKTKSKEKTKLNDSCDGDDFFAIKSYIWIIRDFLKNGYYKNRETVYKQNQNGKINWKRTLSKQALYSNGSFVYKDFVVSSKSSVDNLLVEIHQHCVKKSIFLIGWLFGVRSASIGVKNLKDIELSNAKKKQYIYALNLEIDKTFDDEKQLRLKNMLDVVSGLNNSINGELVYGVDSYHYVFERMIDQIYGTENDLDPYMPTGKWSCGKNASPLFPDSILRQKSDDESDIYVIIDAKCYRYADEGYKNDDIAGLPTTDSIQKQLTYGDHLFKKTNGKNTIYNCFIIPYNKEKQYDKKPAGNKKLLYSELFATGEWRDVKSNKPYEKIYVFLADMRDVIEKWNEYNHDEEKADLINDLKKLSSLAE
ncbi:MAG: LlaJI family restriction endonuclease [Clostridia bacterium]|nr:LlaJI family restriction endonuclease [Clostridia bacterium]